VKGLWRHTKFTRIEDAQSAWEREAAENEELHEKYEQLQKANERMRREWSDHTRTTFNRGYAAAMEDVSAARKP
jgi:hypothetical protein